MIADTRAARIASETAFLDAFASAVDKEPLLRSLLESYSRAVGDPANELVHLYEVRDALSKYYRGERNARSALEIVAGEWDRLGRLANAEPVDQSRHRGKHTGGPRPATAEELAEARAIVKSWIEKFACYARLSTSAPACRQAGTTGHVGRRDQ